MARTYRSRFLGVLAANERRMTRLFGDLAAAVIGDVSRAAGPDGLVPRGAVPDLLTAVNRRVNGFFVQPNSRGQLAPFEVMSNGVVLPLSPYSRALWEALRGAVGVAVEDEATRLRRRLPPDLLAILRAAHRNPLQAARETVREQIFRPNPLARYDAPHTWVDSNGYRLSDRIWNTAGDTRRRLDAMLEDGIRRGRGALNLETGGAGGLARDLEQFLIPGRSLVRTKAPYGIDASFDAMRLARTEITRAHGAAAQASAAMNPFVEQMKWNLSASHPKPDICDDNARGGPNGDGVYPLGEVPAYPAHPMDLCYLTPVVMPAEQRRVILDELREDVRRARRELTDLIGPLLVEQFTDILLRGLTPVHAPTEAIGVGVLL